MPQIDHLDEKSKPKVVKNNHEKKCATMTSSYTEVDLESEHE